VKIQIKPGVSCGRPCIEGTGVATIFVAQRFMAGESVFNLALDYRLSKPLIEEALRYELRRRKMRIAEIPTTSWELSQLGVKVLHRT